MVSKRAPSIPPFPSAPGLRRHVLSVVSQGVFMNMRKYSHAPKIVTLK